MLNVLGEYERTIGKGVGAGEGQMNQPIAVCIDDEKAQLLVADYSNNRVQLFDKVTGEYVRSISSETDGFNGPRGICICKEANLLFISDRENHRIKMFDNSTYTLIRHIGSGTNPGHLPGEFNRPMEMCVGVADGVLLVVDGYNHRVQIIELPELRTAQLKMRQEIAHNKRQSINDSTLCKGGRLAISVDIANDGVLQPIENRSKMKLSFRALSELFDVVLSRREAELLTTYLNNAPSISSFRDAQPEQVLQRNDCAMDKHMILRQSKMFLSILEEFSSVSPSEQSNTPASMSFAFSMNVTNGERSPETDLRTLQLMTPSLFALKALIDQNWKPEDLSRKILKALVHFLCKIEQLKDFVGTLSFSLSDLDRERIINSIVALLKNAVCINVEILFFVLNLILERLLHSKLSSTRYSISNSSSLKGSEASDIPMGPEHSSVIMAYFEIMVTAIEQVKFRGCFLDLPHRRAVSEPREDPELVEHMSPEKFNVRNDVLTVVYGSRFVNLAKYVFLGENSKTSSAIIEATLPAALPQLISLAFRLHCCRQSIRTTTTTATDSSLGHLQMDILSVAKKYFGEVLAEEAAKLRPMESIKRARGGRNIWRVGDTLAVGDLVDCMDKEKCWFESIVHEIFPDNCVKIHYLGWGSKWDDIIYPNEISNRVAPLNTKTKNWRAELYEGGLIEIKCNDDLVNQKWMWGKVTTLNLAEEW